MVKSEPSGDDGPKPRLGWGTEILASFVKVEIGIHIGWEKIMVVFMRTHLDDGVGVRRRVGE